MMKKIKTAVIGVGNMGQHHVRVYSEISDLVAVADVNAENGMRIARKYGVKFYRDYQMILTEEEIGAVSIAVPTELHKNLAITCLQRKIPTLVEKPIAGLIRDAEEIVEEAKKNDTFLMVGHIERFNPAVMKLKKLIDRGRLGQIISLLAVRVGINPPFGKDLDVATDLAIHDVDVFNYLLGEFPRGRKIIRHKVFKHNTADSASIIIEYEKTTGMIQANWITPIKIRKLYVTGTNGFAELDYINQKLVVYSEAHKRKQHGDFFEFIAFHEPPKKGVYISKKEPLKEELKFFLKHSRNGYVDWISRESLMAVRILT